MIISALRYFARKMSVTAPTYCACHRCSVAVVHFKEALDSRIDGAINPY